MIDKVQKKIIEFQMISEGDVVLAAVSGGADSTGLLLALELLRRQMAFTLEVVHVEHGIRGEESREDARFVEKMCQERNIPCHTLYVDAPKYSRKMGIGMEEAARILRYEAFERLAGTRHAKVALAHHMEDNAETVLFQMVRGSGLQGVCGMKAVRLQNDVEYIRPLLAVHREEIENFLREQGIGWREDSTNRQTEYSRNYLRHKVMPQLAELNEQAVEHIHQTAERLTQIRDFVEAETQKAWETLVRQEDGTSAGNWVLDRNGVLQLHPAIQAELLMIAVSKAAGSRKDITSSHIEQLQSLCGKQSGKELHLPYGVIARREYEKLIIGKADLQPGDPKTVHFVTEEQLEDIYHHHTFLRLGLSEKEALSVRVCAYEPLKMEIPKKRYTKWFDYDKIKQGFCIRTRRNGDYFVSDAAGHHKKLQNYFIDEKIPAEKRGQMWLLTQDACVLWLIGGRISENLKVTEETKWIVELEYIGG